MNIISPLAQYNLYTRISHFILLIDETIVGYEYCLQIPEIYFSFFFKYSSLADRNFVLVESEMPQNQRKKLVVILQ